MRSRSVGSRAREAKQKHGEELHKRREHAPCLHIVHPMLGLGSQESTMLGPTEPAERWQGCAEKVGLLRYKRLPASTRLPACTTVCTHWTWSCAFQELISTPRATVDMASCSDLRISVFNMQNSWPRAAHLQNQPWENLQVGKVRRYRKS